MAFDAPRLVVANTAHLLMRLTKDVVVQEIGFGQALESMLPDFSQLGHHTGIIHVTPSSATKYVWSHRTNQPWGHRLPPQCHQCGVFQIWTTVPTNARQTYIFKCMNQKCGWNGNKKVGEVKTFEFALAEGAEFIAQKKKRGGGWLKLSL